MNKQQNFHTAGTPRKRGRPPKEDAVASVMASAKSLFAEYGYKNVSVADLLKEAKVSRPTFYKHFMSKEDVAEKIFFDFQQSTMQKVLITAQMATNASELWEKSIEAYLNALLEQGNLLPQLIDFQTLNETTKNKQYELVQGYAETLSMLISAGGQIQASPQYIEAFITAVDRFVIGICFRKIQGEEIKSSAEYVAEAKEFLMQLANVVVKNS